MDVARLNQKQLAARWCIREATLELLPLLEEQARGRQATSTGGRSPELQGNLA